MILSLKYRFLVLGIAIVGAVTLRGQQRIQWMEVWEVCLIDTCASQLLERYQYDAQGHMTHYLSGPLYCSQVDTFDAQGRIIHSEHHCGETVNNGEEFYTYKGNEVFILRDLAGMTEEVHQRLDEKGRVVWERLCHHDRSGEEEDESFIEVSQWEYGEHGPVRQWADRKSFFEEGQHGIALHRGDTTFQPNILVRHWEYDPLGNLVRDSLVEPWGSKLVRMEYKEGTRLRTQKQVDYRGEDGRHTSQTREWWAYEEGMVLPSLHYHEKRGDVHGAHNDTIYTYEGAGRMAQVTRKEAIRWTPEEGSQTLCIQEFSKGLLRAEYIPKIDYRKRYAYGFW